MPLLVSDHRRGLTSREIRDGTASRPVSPIKRAIMNSFRDMSGLDFLRIFEIGNSAADFQDSIVGASRQPQTRHSPFEHGLAFGINAAVPANQSRGHGRV